MNRAIAQGESVMKYNAPTQITFVISLVLAALAVLSGFIAIPSITANAFWILLIAYVVLAVGVVYRRH